MNVRRGVTDINYVNFHRVMARSELWQNLHKDVRPIVLENLREWMRRCDVCNKFFPEEVKEFTLFSQAITKYGGRLAIYNVYRTCSESCMNSKRLAVETLHAFGDL